METIGKRQWAIVDGYLPAWSNGPDPEMTSHEAICILNAGDREARVELTLYFADREPVGPYSLTVPPRRTLHQRFNDLEDPERVPTNLSYSCIAVSDQPVIVQQTRLDSRQAENGLFSTIAYAQ
ncbi:sensory rhodopsin transducer [Aquicoccus sp. SCR17]|nr:sensory rhodopsin transducer [Carideicomes alvinocaridis]